MNPNKKRSNLWACRTAPEHGVYDIKKSAHCCWACWCLPKAPAADQLYQSQKPEAKHKADRHQPQPVRYRIQTHMYPGQLMEPVVHFPKAHPGAVGADGLHADPAHRPGPQGKGSQTARTCPNRNPSSFFHASSILSNVSAFAWIHSKGGTEKSQESACHMGDTIRVTGILSA